MAKKAKQLSAQEKHKELTKLERLFQYGIMDYEQGLSEFSIGLPNSNPEWIARNNGWKAANEMAQIKSKWLKETRELVD